MTTGTTAAAPAEPAESAQAGGSTAGSSSTTSTTSSGSTTSASPRASVAPRAGTPRASTTRAAGTRAALLQAAREVFTSSGFAEASIADVVGRADASVGSLYHHFGGKAELYLALFEEYQLRQEERTATAVKAARAADEEDPLTLFVEGARAYLDGCWAERDLARLFLAGGGPPGFESVARRRYRDWTRRNAALLEAGDADADEPWGDALVLVLTTVMSEAGHEVAVCEDPERAARLASDVLGLVRRIGTPSAGGATPAGRTSSEGAPPAGCTAPQGTPPAGGASVSPALPTAEGAP
jgi:AcrR family transcriptional regulator